MLKRILSIAGRPGLYRLVSQGKNMLIIESLADGKRLPAYARDKIISLGDVSIYTNDGEDTPLSGVLESIRVNNNGAKVDVKNADLRKDFAAALPNFDEDRVKTSDIKKVYQWYNLLIDAGFTAFIEEEKEETEPQEEAAEETPAEEK